MPISIEKLQESSNIVDLLYKMDDGEQEIHKIGSQVVKGYKIDEDSRAEWKETIDEAMKIAKQTMEPKNHPWPGASNVKYPLITDAAIDYASRTLPEIIQNERVVKVATAGMDPKSEKYARADRVARYMSYQLVQDSPDWEDSLDKLLQILPVLGTVFKKTYYSSLENRNCSELCVPDKIVVNYNAQSLESARRITHILTMYANDIVERQRNGIFCEDIDVETLISSSSEGNLEDNDQPITLLEQHCWIDLDDDGYKEPYIVTVHKETEQVLRIVSRFKKIQRNKKNKISCIEPIQYFTDFHFIRSPDGGFYSQGFGSLLLPINSAINTLINQLIDSGTLNNTQGGFIGRGLRIKNGEFKIKMGEWKVLDAASGTDVGKNIFPLPTKEPSQTLFSLLGMLIQVGRDLSQTNDVMQGKQPAQNVASNTIQTLVEQGTKVFVAINKRLYRSLKKEYSKLYELNSEYINPEHYKQFLDDPAADYKKDFELNSLDVHPVADPTISSTAQRLIKANVIQGLKTADPRAVDYYILQSMQLESTEIDLLLPKPDPNAPPAPEVQKIMSEARLNEIKAQQIQLQTTVEVNANKLSQEEFMLKMRESDAQVYESMARVWKMQKDAAHGDAKIAIAGGKMQQQESLKQASLVHKHAMDQEDLQFKAIQEGNKTVKDSNDTKLKAAEIASKIEIEKMKQENKPPKEGE